MTKAEEAASIAAYGWHADNEGHLSKEVFPEPFKRGYLKGYEQAQQDIIAIIHSRIDEILGDAQPASILRVELQELIKNIEQ